MITPMIVDLSNVQIAINEQYNGECRFNGVAQSYSYQVAQVFTQIESQLFTAEFQKSGQRQDTEKAEGKSCNTTPSPSWVLIFLTEVGCPGERNEDHENIKPGRGHDGVQAFDDPDFSFPFSNKHVSE